MQLFFIYISVFICVLIFTDYLIRHFRDSREKKQHVNYRISLIEGNPDRKIVYERMLRERGLDYSQVKSPLSWIRRIIGQSGVRFEGARSVVYIVAIALAGFVTFTFLGLNLIISLLLDFFLVFFLVVFWFARARSQRIKKFVSQLPDALDVSVRSLAAGHPLSTSISLVAREMPDPVGSEFGIMTDEMTYGVDIDTATRNMSTRVGADELDLLGISLTVQRGSGGNLSEILSNLADMLRRRAMMKAKIKSLSAEGRMTSWIMLVFPFFLYGLISLISPDYFDPLWASDSVNIILIVAFSHMAVGMLILRKIVNFDF
jgi:tight adherence protein B